jgi:23S rRNA (uridine2552-2'-O)-methyltransferase
MYRKDRQNEFYTRLAKEENYPARSVYKLKEMDEKYHIVKQGDQVLDLGCAPGSWLLYLSQKVGSKGKVIGIDIEEVKIPEKTNIVFIKKDILDLKESDFKNKFEAVVSDLAPKTSGIKSLDSGRSLELAEKSFEITKSVLVPGGNFVCKIFEGEENDEFLRRVGDSFAFTKRFKPKAVIKKSKEFYVIAKDYIKTAG